MNLNNIIFFIIAISIVNPTQSQVRLVLSAALTDNHFEFRKEQYIKAFNICAQYGYQNPYIIEALKKKGPTFLDDYSNNVFYASTNNQHLRNKGINEAKTMLEGLAHFNCDPEDMIIKVTGRYHLLSDSFLRTIESNLNYDAIVKLNPLGHLLTLGFAMKYKHFKQMYESLNYYSLEHDFISIEVVCGEYIQHKSKEGSLKVLYLERLDIEANLYGSSNAPNAKGIIIF